MTKFISVTEITPEGEYLDVNINFTNIINIKLWDDGAVEIFTSIDGGRSYLVEDSYLELTAKLLDCH